jgi:hypothetical protein
MGNNQSSKNKVDRKIFEVLEVRESETKNACNHKYIQIFLDKELEFKDKKTKVIFVENHSNFEVLDSILFLLLGSKNNCDSGLRSDFSLFKTEVNDLFVIDLEETKNFDSDYYFDSYKYAEAMINLRSILSEKEIENARLYKDNDDEKIFEMINEAEKRIQEAMEFRESFNLRQNCCQGGYYENGRNFNF